MDTMATKPAASRAGSGQRRRQHGERRVDVQGCGDDVFAYEGGVSVPAALFRAAFGDDGRILEYQVRQTLDGADIDLRVSEHLDAYALRLHLERELVRLGLPAPRVCIRYVDDIERAGVAAKLKRSVALRSV